MKEPASIKFKRLMIDGNETADHYVMKDGRPLLAGDSVISGDHLTVQGPAPPEEAYEIKLEFEPPGDKQINLSIDWWPAPGRGRRPN